MLIEASMDARQRLWRYMDLAKFLSIVQTSALFFARGDSFEDPFEGSYPQQNLHDFGSREDGYVADGWKRMVAISCWYASDCESDAMWRLYTKNRQGIAISTRFGVLQEAVDSVAYMQQVKYIGFDRDKATIHLPYDVFHYKRKSFWHEREVRAIIMSLPESQGIVNGMAVPGEPSEEGLDSTDLMVEVNLGKVLESVVVSPYSLAWFHRVVEDVLSKYEKDSAKLEVSELAGDPAYARI
jgi:hypothetical protein